MTHYYPDILPRYTMLWHIITQIYHSTCDFTEIMWIPSQKYVLIVELNHVIVASMSFDKSNSIVYFSSLWDLIVKLNHTLFKLLELYDLLWDCSAPITAQKMTIIWHDLPICTENDSWFTYKSTENDYTMTLVTYIITENDYNTTDIQTIPHPISGCFEK